MAKTDKLKSLIPMEEIEHEAQQQIYAALEHDCVKQLAIMPDVHTGYSLPIGAVALLDGMVNPAYVGYDISCGMCFCATDIPVETLTPERKQQIFKDIYRSVPCGEGGKRDKGFDFEEFHSGSGDKQLEKEVNANVHKQLGTLGGGNHFIEIGDLNGNIAITIHSGSRNLGHRICTYYSKNHPEFLSIDSDIGRAYLADMRFCVKWAKHNRFHIIDEILNHALLVHDDMPRRAYLNLSTTCTHNFAEVLPEGILHRKGATPAQKDKLGIIPGNMRDGVYIVKGKGNPEYLWSSSHGAGRTMSRAAAKKTFNMNQFQLAMDGIVAKIEQTTLDESPMAYKDIERVMELQAPVVEVMHKVRPLVNAKG